MKTIYMTENQWQNGILRGELDCAAGGSGRISGSRACSLPAGGDKVVDLAAWKAERLAAPDEPGAGGQWVSTPGRYGDRELIRRRHRKLTAALDRAELAATLAVAAALAALVVRVLLF